MSNDNTSGVFFYCDPATISRSTEPFVKSWSKVDVNYTSFSRKEVPATVYNYRDAVKSGTKFGIDVSGFDVVHSPAKEKDFVDEKAVREGYYAEVEALLREKLENVAEGKKIRKVVIFDHTIRKNTDNAPRKPVAQVHVDQTPRAAEVRVRRHVEDPAEAEELLKGRYQLINVWRPIGHPASDYPLAVIDWRTTSPDDMVPIDLLYPKRPEDDDGDDRGKEIAPDPSTYPSTEGYEVKGETYGIVPNETHRFYYVKDMTPEEAMFIKCFDSRSQGQPGGKEGIAALTPHTAFVDPQTSKGAPPRQSIEVRCLVFYE